MRHVIAALVMNEPGVLAHVAGMFAARGFNIDSLVVGRTEHPEISRMTIVINGDNQMLDQVRKQLGKLVEVVRVVDYADVDFVERDLMLLRVSAAPDQRSEILEMVDMFRGTVVDVASTQLMIKLSGTEDKLEAFVELLRPYGIVELARTGVIAMPRGEKIEGEIPRPQRRAERPQAPADKGNAPTHDIRPEDLPPG